MSDIWNALDAELDRWAAAGRTATFWWRDDDAVAPTPALDRLIALAAGAPLTLAVIPEPAKPALFERLADVAGVSVAPHGWRHTNHAGPAEKKAEFGIGRGVDAALWEIGAGWSRLTGLAGTVATVPLFVPPWNRIAPAVADRLPGVGLPRLSVYGPRRPAQAAGRLNTHVDPIAWRAGAAFLGEEPAIALLLSHLCARRAGGEASVDPDEPTGLLTHHLRHDEETWAFLSRLRCRIEDHDAALWVSAGRGRAAP